MRSPAYPWTTGQNINEDGIRDDAHCHSRPARETTSPAGCGSPCGANRTCPLSDQAMRCCTLSPISDGYRYGDRVSPACQENVYKEGSPFPALSDPPPLSGTRLPQDGHADALYGPGTILSGRNLTLSCLPSR